jgi:hypothetical protein
MKLLTTLLLLPLFSGLISARDDDAYVTKVKELLDAGTCDDVSTDNDLCGTDGTSYYKVFKYKGKRILVSSGIPDHDAELDAERQNPNVRCERWQFVELPLSPVSADASSSLSLGATGWVKSGGVTFDHRSSRDGDTAWYNEGSSLDSCNGHSNGNMEYHYHLNPVCITGASRYGACKQIGYLYDGNPIYGYCSVDSTELKSCWTLTTGEDGSNDDNYYYDTAAYDAGTCHLGACNDYTFADGTFGYVMSEDYPYVPKCRWGDTAYSPCGFSL